MVAINAAGNAVPASATTTTANALKVIGRAEYVVNGIPGAERGEQSRRGRRDSDRGAQGRLHVRAATARSPRRRSGGPCFALDDNNVTATDRASGAAVQQYAAAGHSSRNRCVAARCGSISGIRQPRPRDDDVATNKELESRWKSAQQI